MTKHFGDQAHSITLEKPYAWPGLRWVGSMASTNSAPEALSYCDV
jgi:hypothetical protein